MSLELMWKGGGRGSVLETDGDHAVVVSTHPAPPGTTLEATMGLGASGALRMKVRECARQADGSFRMRGRWVDLTRRAREDLLLAMARG